MKSLFSTFTHTQNAPVELVMKKISIKFHQEALTIIVFACIALKLEIAGISIHVHPCHPVATDDGKNFHRLSIQQRNWFIMFKLFKKIANSMIQTL